MKSCLRWITQSIAFLITLILVCSVNVTPQSSLSFFSNITANKAAAAHAHQQSNPQSNSEHDHDPVNTCNNLNSTEEIHIETVLVKQGNMVPSGYSVFIPMDPLPMVGHSIPPLQRPPRA